MCATYDRSGCVTKEHPRVNFRILQFQVEQLFIQLHINQNKTGLGTQTFQKSRTKLKILCT